jgi:polyphosphate:AMP phosphotransferase
MFSVAKVDAKVSRREYEQQELDLRARFVEAQQRLRTAKCSLIVVVAGDDRPGCSEVVNLLHEWADPRGLETHALTVPTEDERQHPPQWRYWRRLPADGRIGIFSRAWTHRPIADRIQGLLTQTRFETKIQRVRRFEQMLTDDGTPIVKFWLHLSKAQLAKRLDRARKHPRKYWQVSDVDWTIFDHYDDSRPYVEYAMETTSTDAAPWYMLNSAQRRHRNLTIGQTILDILTRRLEGEKPQPAPAAGPIEIPDALGALDLSRTLEKDVYEKKLDQQRAKISRLTRKANRDAVPMVIVFEGQDAAGKGGIIRRLTGAINAELYRVVSIAAPDDEERAHHYLWRFWRHMPRDGQITIFDRTWYGRVLVERIEGFATEYEWRRAYDEINAFEEQIADRGVLLKFWLQIDEDEQMCRFKARQETPHKQYKITDEDWRNREKWPQYHDAVNEMVARTSTDAAPWHLIAANNKRYARIEVLKAVSRALKARL